MTLRTNGSFHSLPSLLEGWGGLFPEVNEILESAVRRPVAATKCASKGFFALDVVEHADNFEVDVELPGISREQVELERENRHLRISVSAQGEREEKDEETDAEGAPKFLLRERRSFQGSRTLVLPETASEEDVSAKLEAGILKISIPKQKEAAKKTIQIS